MPLNLQKKKYYGLACLLVFGGRATAEVFEIKAGVEQTKVVSSSYYSVQNSTLQLAGSYSRAISSRWSGFIQYQVNSDSSLSATVSGVTFQSEELKVKGGAIRGDGSAEISTIPIWLYSAGFGFGLFKYVDVLRSNNPGLGTKNEQGVRADLYGLQFKASIARLVSDDWAMSLNGSYAVATAQGFGINSTCLSLGLLRLIN